MGVRALKWNTDLANGDQAGVHLFPGYWITKLYPAGADDPVFGPASLRMRWNKVYLVFAVGSLANGTSDSIVEPLEAPQAPEM